MQFKVPQFIDVEDKLFGPFTFKEFAYMAGGAGLMYILYKLLPFLVAVPLMVIVGGFAALLVFYKINNKPFIYYVQAGITYGLNSKLYIWKQHLKKPDAEKEKIKVEEKKLPAMTTSRLKDLAWSLDVLDQTQN
jgi:PrgI family protein